MILDQKTSKKATFPKKYGTWFWLKLQKKAFFSLFLSWCQIVRCQIVLVPNCPGAKLSWCQIVRCQIVLPPLFADTFCSTESGFITKNSSSVWILSSNVGVCDAWSPIWWSGTPAGLEAIGRRHRTEERSQYSPAIQFFNRPLKSSLLCSEERLRWKMHFIRYKESEFIWSHHSVACFGPVGSPPRPKLLSLLTGQEGSNPFDKGAQFQRVLP